MNSDAPVARHMCGNWRCANPEHMLAGTFSQNSADKRIHGTNGAKLDIHKARVIRQSVRSNIELAKEYACSTNLISQIKLGKAWKDNDTDEKQE